MKLTKFERRRQEIERKHQEELRALEEAEAKERRKLIDPVIEKMGKVAEEEARKILERSPEILESYSFRKRDVAKVISAALESLFAAAQEEEETAEGTGPANKESPGAGQASEEKNAEQDRGEQGGERQPEPARDAAQPAPSGDTPEGRRGFFQRD